MSWTHPCPKSLVISRPVAVLSQYEDPSSGQQQDRQKSSWILCLAWSSSKEVTQKKNPKKNKCINVYIKLKFKKRVLRILFVRGDTADDASGRACV